jgi:Protein of unknown function (DUF4089)
MTEPLDPVRFVPLAAAAVALPLAPEDLNHVISSFALLARVAGPLMAFRIEEEIVAASIFSPDQGG